MTQGKGLEWGVSEEEYQIVRKIVKRGVRIKEHARGITVDRGYKLDLEMDIIATHLNGCRLKLLDLYNSSDLDFVHDVFGIQAHLNRQTGKLENSFLPRYAEKQ